MSGLPEHAHRSPAGGLPHPVDRAGYGRQAPCSGADPSCPCQDGDTCHYRDSPITGTKAMQAGQEVGP